MAGLESSSNTLLIRDSASSTACTGERSHRSHETSCKTRDKSHDMRGTKECVGW